MSTHSHLSIHCGYPTIPEAGDHWRLIFCGNMTTVRIVAVHQGPTFSETSVNLVVVRDDGQEEEYVYTAWASIFWHPSAKKLTGKPVPMPHKPQSPIRQFDTDQWVRKMYSEFQATQPSTT